MKFKTEQIKHASFLTSSILSLLISVPALSQIPSGTTREELSLPNPVSTSRDTGVKIERREKSVSNCPFEASDLKATIRKIDFLEPSNLTLPAELASILDDIMPPNDTNSLKAICDIRDQAYQALREKGWIASVQIPQQNLVDTLRLDVVTARLTSAVVIGDAGPYRGLIETKISNLKDLVPFNEKSAERILLDMNDVPGLNVKLSLAPTDGKLGDLIGKIAVVYEPYAAFVNVRNYNAKRTGRETLYGRFEYYGLTKQSDVTYIGAQSTVDFKEQWIGQLGHEFGIGPNNTRIGGDLTVARVRPTVGTLDFESEAVIANLRVRHPLLREVNQSADITLGLDYADQSVDVTNVPLSKDKTRAIYLNSQISGNKSDPFTGKSFGYEGFIEMRQGLSGLGATRIGDAGLSVTDNVPASRPFGEADSFVVRAGVNLATAMGPKFGVRVKTEAQWSDNPLLNYDEYSVGNLSIGRGYDPGANSGDRAIGGAFEAYTNIQARGGPNVQAFGFYDVVQLENLDPFTTDKVRTLSSIGGGIRMAVKKGVQLELAYAKPLDRAVISDLEKPTDRVLVSITTKFPDLFR